MLKLALACETPGLCSRLFKAARGHPHLMIVHLFNYVSGLPDLSQMPDVLVLATENAETELPPPSTPTVLLTENPELRERAMSAGIHWVADPNLPLATLIDTIYESGNLHSHSNLDRRQARSEETDKKEGNKNGDSTEQTSGGRRRLGRGRRRLGRGRRKLG